MDKKYLSCWHISHDKAKHVTFLNIGAILGNVTKCYGEVEGEWNKANFDKLVLLVDGFKYKNWEDWEMKFNGKGWKVYLSYDFCNECGGGFGVLERKEQYDLDFCKDEFDKVWSCTGHGPLK